MRAAIFNPYLDTLGGGERYTMAFASALVERDFRVDMQWRSEGIKKKLEKRFGINLKGINVVGDIKRGDGYDVVFWVSDGSIPLLRGRHNFLHFQIPFTNANGKSLMNRMKLFRIEKVICNSLFTKNIIDEEYGVNSVVVYPPVDISNIRAKEKENIIVSIGRFSQLTQSKRQDVLVDVFKKLYQKDLYNWKLVLAGGSEVGGDEYVVRIRKMSEGYPIEMIENPSFDGIKELYGKAKFFWSASGFDIDSEKEPEKVEHFGITVVEAMAAGAVPFVFDAGGHKEIVTDGKNGFLFSSRRELSLRTKELLENQTLYRRLAKNAVERSKNFSYRVFNESVDNLVK
jgi:glycosyltransferase involved in cell wall biosynthesis